VRALAIVVVLGLALACASSGSVGTTSTVYADRTQLWLAAQTAIREMGGLVVHADEASGTVAGRLDVEGTPIDLSVSLWGSPASEAVTVDYFDVDAHAALAGGGDVSEEWQRRLRYLADELMDRISAAATGRARGLQP
jgi:hypothetical protein